MQICIAAKSFDKYSETFIRNHVECLPFKIVTLTGSKLCKTSKENLLAKNSFHKALIYLLGKLGALNKKSFLSRKRAHFFLANGVQLVLAEFAVVGIQVMESCRIANIPLIVHFHGYDAHNNTVTDHHMKVYKTMFQQAVAVIAVSRAMVTKLEEIGAPPEKIHYVPYLVNPESFPLTFPLKAPPIFLSVGRFVEKKAPHLTLQAFAIVLRKFPDARLEMAGDGPLLAECQSMAEDLKINHAVTFHGSKDHQWVMQAMGRVRCFVQHSVEASNGDSEGTPVAILEAQCSGLPVVATRHTGIADVVLPGITGYLCEERDYYAMANNMLTILRSSDDEIEAMSHASRKRILAEFGEAQTIDKLASIITGSMDLISLDKVERVHKS
jgi:colanic acid/amylovoran biosynthesis glycosyltransferase